LSKVLAFIECYLLSPRSADRNKSNMCTSVGDDSRPMLSIDKSYHQISGLIFCSCRNFQQPWVIP
jgi:hypothetical protein